MVDKLKMWDKCDEVAKLYLLARAVHLVYFGDEVANVAYPQPSFAGARELVSLLAILLRSKEKLIIEEMEEKEENARREERAKELVKVEERCARKIEKIEYFPADNLPACVLSESERMEVLKACEKEIEGLNMKEAIENIVKVWELLRKPANLIKVPSGRYIEKEVPSLKYAEMTHQMEQELMGLPRFTAWAKIAQEKGGKQLVIKRKIQTLPLPDVLPDADERRAVIERNTQQFYIKRDEIEGGL